MFLISHAIYYQLGFGIIISYKLSIIIKIFLVLSVLFHRLIFATVIL
ncbi:Cell shape-determining protein MreC [Rickettsia prowazekii str. Breinl]|nr:Cell shape-determining protein MreC [Rickettsia prowazekii str. Breinl]